MNLSSISENYLKSLISHHRDWTTPAKEHFLSKRALHNFKFNGIPSRKNEHWTFTDLEKYLPENPSFSKKTSLQECPANLIAEYVIDKTACILFIDGLLDKEFTKLPPGIQIVNPEEQELKHVTGIIERNLESSFISNFNTCIVQDLLHIVVDETYNSKIPLSIASVTTAREKNYFQSQKILFTVSKNVHCTILESFVSLEEESSYVHMPSILFIVEKNSQVDHYKLQNESKKVIHLASLEGSVKENAKLNTFNLTLGSHLSRQDYLLDLNAIHAHTILDGIYVIDGEQRTDHHSTICHNNKETHSKQLLKGFISEDAHGSFKGKIVIQRHAVRSTASQLNKNLLLSRGSKIQTKPQLEIYTDDVRCTHGATIGSLDEEQIFYLTTRGFSRKAAKVMLCYGFAMDSILKIESSPIQKFMMNHLIQKLEDVHVY